MLYECVFAVNLSGMNKNKKQVKPCLFCGKIFNTVANRNVYCGLKCRLAAESRQRTGSECWEWDGAKDKDGYGRLRWRWKEMRAHVAAWLAWRGKVPKDSCVLHTCDNPSCVNPDHLWLGTQGDNVADRHAKGRTRCNPESNRHQGRLRKHNVLGQFMCGV